MSLTRKWKYGNSCSSFVVIMLLHEGLTHMHAHKLPRLHFGESFTLSIWDRSWYFTLCATLETGKGITWSTPSRMHNCFALEARAKVKQQQHPFGMGGIQSFAQGHFNSFGKHHRCDANDYVVTTSQLECTLFGMRMSCVMLQLTEHCSLLSVLQVMALCRL